MKVGTDGCLLGAWCPLPQSGRVLDVGTGTGVIALMCAQRNDHLQIEAIDSQLASAREAAQNFRFSAYHQRLHAQHIRLQDFQPSQPFELVISNPPFFAKSLKSHHSERNEARHADWLQPTELVAFALHNLTASGSLATIYPEEAYHKLALAAGESGLHLTHLRKVRPTPTKPVHRVLSVFSKAENPLLKEETLVVEDKGHLGWSADFRALLKPFYLDF